MRMPASTTCGVACRRPVWAIVLTAASLLSTGCREAVASGSSPQDQKIDAPLLERLSSGGQIDVALLLKSQLLLGPDALDGFKSLNADRNRSDLRREVISSLKQAAAAEQAEVLAALGSPQDARGVWIANAIFVRLTPDQIRAASALELVRYVYLMPRAPADFDDPGHVGTVLVPEPRPPFSVDGRRVPWNLERIGATRAWESYGATGEGIVVAMIDNGTNYTHPDLASNIWVNSGEIANNGVDDDANGLIDDYYGFDFRRGVVEVQLNPANGNGAGHGTWTAGIVLGDGSGGTITGIAPRARLMITMAGGDTYAMSRSLQYALEEGADVATMSFSLPNLGNVRGMWRLMADHAVAAGLVQVSGAGNFQQSAPAGVQQRIPEGIPSVISVGGVDPNLELVRFSSLGPVSWSSVAFYGDHPNLTKPDVAAFPGPEYPLIRAEGAGYLDPNTRRGNSFSGPHATGVAALMLSANPELPAWEVQEIMRATARDLGPEGTDNETGAGLIDAEAAVREALARR